VVSLTIAVVCYLVAAILFVVAATPFVEPYHSRLVAIALAFFAVGHVVP
jgi:hypothetical protein